jgi:hypothetical protein
MLASQIIPARVNPRPMNDFIAGQQFAGLNSGDHYLHIPADLSREYSWAEETYQAGEITAMVARYSHIPLDLKKKLDEMIAAGYCKNLFLAPFYEASLLILSSGIIPGLRFLAERSKEVYAEYCATAECQRAKDFVSCRKSDDIVVLVLKSGSLMGSMTLYPFSKKEDLPSLSYLRLGPAKNRLFDVPAFEVGRLAKATGPNEHAEKSPADVLSTVWLAAAFLVARDFVVQNGLLKHQNSYVCGDTYGSLLASLQHFFPIVVDGSAIRTDILDEKNGARDVAIYFLQRQVLGFFESANDFMATIAEIGNSKPDVARRIVALMEAGLKKTGIKSLQKFDPKKFRVNFFYFPYQHPKTAAGLKRLEKILLKSTTARSISWH